MEKSEPRIDTEDNKQWMQSFKNRNPSMMRLQNKGMKYSREQLPEESTYAILGEKLPGLTLKILTDKGLIRFVKM